MSKIRALRATDLPQLLELSRAAGWNQTQTDWERTLALAGDMAYGIEGGGRVVSTTTAIRYGVDLAWIGMVLTHPGHRGQGNARALVEYTLKQLRAQKIRWAKLDATDQGRGVYASFGFEEECAVERWKRLAGHGPRTQASSHVRGYVPDPSFDRAYFPALRLALLNALLRDGESGYLTGFGYSLGRPGDLAAYFGPCVVRTRDAARELLQTFLARHPDEEIFWDLFPDNQDAVQLAIDHGFEPARQLTRMSLRSAPDALPLLRNNSSVFAIAGFEYG